MGVWNVGEVIGTKLGLTGMPGLLLTGGTCNRAGSIIIFILVCVGPLHFPSNIVIAINVNWNHNNTMITTAHSIFSACSRYIP